MPGEKRENIARTNTRFLRFFMPNEF